MVIRTLETTYTVIRQLPYKGGNNVYACGEEGKDELFLLVEFANKETIPDAVAFLSEHRKDGEFTDFKDCFFSGENFYALFSFLQSKSLEDILQDDGAGLEERLSLIRALLEKWMLMKMPAYFIYDCARMDHLRYTDAGKCVPCFELEEIRQKGSCGFAEGQGRLARVWHEVFKPEISKRTVVELVDFERELEEGNFEDVQALFVAYDKLEAKVLGQEAKEWVQPKTWPFRLWERIKTFFPFVKRVIATALVIAAFMFLFYTMKKSMESGGQQRQFEQIGTLKIRDDAAGPQGDKAAGEAGETGNAGEAEETKDTGEAGEAGEAGGTVNAEEAGETGNAGEAEETKDTGEAGN